MLARLGKLLAWLFLAAGIVLMSLGVIRLWQDQCADDRYHELAEAVGSDEWDDLERNASSAEGGAQIEASTLPSNTVAWVRVDSTSINLPVASGDRGFTWYLHHDLWGNPTELGCPFLDPRCPSANASHVLAYGHHVSLSNAMFSPLHRCYRQEVFDGLGSCTWSTASGQIALAPLCALSVDQHWDGILRFSFASEAEFRQWALDIVKQASATAPNAEQTAMEARRIVTLVTCSSEVSGQRWRTLVLFVE